jgi:energy-coupling factor transport system substrate-specific component
MRELVAVWSNTRTIVQVGLTAALYAAVLIPFKPIPIFGGVTEVRPANAIPIVCALLFGPAAAYGAAFGNLIGDFFGTLGPGSIFGFIGNFLYAYVPYRIWGVLRLAPKDGKRHPLSGGGMAEFLLAAGLASIICAGVIAWGVEILGVLPFKVLWPVISLNNFVMAAVLGPPLMLALYPRVRAWGLLHWQILGTEPVRRSLRVSLGTVLCWAGAIAAPLVAFGIPGDEMATAVFVQRMAAPMAAMVIGALLI